MIDTVYLPLAYRTPEDVAASSTASLPGLSVMATSSTLTSSAAVQIATYVASTLTTSIISSTASSVMTANATGLFNTTEEDAGAGKGECKLLGPFAVLVQGALGLLALLSLVYKRWRERPQRPVKIWAFDASKQVVGSALLHLANLGMSQFSSGQLEAARAHAAAIAEAASKAVATGDKNKFGHNPNPCSFYLLNLAIDTTIGIPILIVILRLYAVGAALIVKPPESIQSGNYGQPPKWTWWLKQAVLYFFGLLSMKACVFLIFELCPWIIVVGNWALRWTEGNEAIQIAFVMLIFPLIMNALQYYIIDSFIKKKASDPDGTEEREREEGEEEGLLTPDSDTIVADEGDIDQARKEAKVLVKSEGSERKSNGVSKENEPPGTPQTGESSGSSSNAGEQSPARKTT